MPPMPRALEALPCRARSVHPVSSLTPQHAPLRRYIHLCAYRPSRHAHGGPPSKPHFRRSTRRSRRRSGHTSRPTTKLSEPAYDQLSTQPSPKNYLATTVTLPTARPARCSGSKVQRFGDRYTKRSGSSARAPQPPQHKASNDSNLPGPSRTPGGVSDTPRHAPPRRYTLCTYCPLAARDPIQPTTALDPACSLHTVNLLSAHCSRRSPWTSNGSPLVYMYLGQLAPGATHIKAQGRNLCATSGAPKDTRTATVCSQDARYRQANVAFPARGAAGTQ
jgi:hypothetical protein